MYNCLFWEGIFSSIVISFSSFMWQICSHIPQTLAGHSDITLLSAKLGISFVLETLIHAKEKVCDLFLSCINFCIIFFFFN